MKKAAILLSGCGNIDGSEIHETVAALIALDKAGWEVIFTAPDIQQARTVNYLTGKADEPRRVLNEAARIARGRISPFRADLADEVDAVVIPGGLGAASTLCDFAEKGSSCEALPEVLDFLKRIHSAGKPVAAMCIAPVLVARCLPGAAVTIGTHRKTAALIEEMGCRHVECSATEAVADPDMMVVTTPAYMTAKGPGEVLEGALEMIAKLDSLITPS